MINAITGRPGGGKSYEAVAFHIIPALKDGRKVITNVAVNLDHFVKVFGEEVRELLIVIDGQLNEYGSSDRPFSKIADYQDDWRDEHGRAALYVIDEAHTVLPARGCPTDILEFYSMHRHHGIDITLMTQNLRKVHRDIKDMIEVQYYCVKNTAMGSSKSYTRKVKNGANGTVLNEGIRTYKKDYFPFYQSHTASNVTVQEALAKDIKPLWKQWQMWLGPLLIIGGLGYFFSSGGFFAGMGEKKDKPKVQQTDVQVKTDDSSPAPAAPPEGQPSNQDFGALSGFDLWASGYSKQISYISRSKAVSEIDVDLTFYRIYIDVYQDDFKLFSFDHMELEKIGYQFAVLAECVYKVTWKEATRIVVCGDYKELTDNQNIISKSVSL